MLCAQRVSVITFIRYAQNRKIGKIMNLKPDLPPQIDVYYFTASSNEQQVPLINIFT